MHVLDVQQKKRHQLIYCLYFNVFGNDLLYVVQNCMGFFDLWIALVIGKTLLYNKFLYMTVAN